MRHQGRSPRRRLLPHDRCREPELPLRRDGAGRLVRVLPAQRLRRLLPAAVHRRHQQAGPPGHPAGRVPPAQAGLHPQRQPGGRLREPREGGHREAGGRHRGGGRHPGGRRRHLVRRPLPDVQRGPREAVLRGPRLAPRLPLLRLHRLRGGDGAEAGGLLRVRLQGVHRPEALLRHLRRRRRPHPVVRLPRPAPGHPEGRRHLGGRGRLG
mmetsp:Transcript_107583/g.314568  ORF Transcript_107583/g.314568 Transcript_107583/m.314568 type:complete len:210 (+) Transcript_107583:378-1007(+)